MIAVPFLIPCLFRRLGPIRLITLLIFTDHLILSPAAAAVSQTFNSLNTERSLLQFALNFINRLLLNNAPFTAPPPFPPPPPPPISKSQPDPVGTVSASKAGFQSGASLTCGGSVSNHLWSSRYKDCIHLLTALRSHCGTDNYLTVRGQQGLCRPLLLRCQWHECAFQPRLHLSHEENETDNESFWRAAGARGEYWRS